MQEMIYQAPQGYPLPECLCYNTADLRMLTEFYSGRASELTTTMQYSYQNTVLHRCRPEIAEALGKINMVEMRHLSLLGQCIALMGGDPQFIRPAQKQYWNARLVNYATDPCSLLLCDMRAELDAADAYRTAARRCCNTALRPFLERLAADETLHAECLQQLIHMAGCCR